MKRGEKCQTHSKLLGNWSERMSLAKNVKSASQDAFGVQVSAEAPGACWRQKALLGSAQSPGLTPAI